MTNTSNRTNRLAAPTTEISPEHHLLTCIQEQSTVFESAVQLIEKLERAARRRELGDPDLVAQLQKSLDRVVAAQQKVASAHAEFKTLKSTPSATLANALARHEQQLRTLIDRTDSLQEVFKSVRNDISSQLDTDTRRRTMQTAYQKSLRTV